MIGIILAGGLSSRLGGHDKTLRLLGGQSILAHLWSRLERQCSSIVLNANGDPARFGPQFDCVVPDVGPRVGPLGGILAGLEFVAAHYPDQRFALTVPCDAPFVPLDLVARLSARQGSARSTVVCARSGGRLHPVVALWAVDLRAEVRAAIAGGTGRVRDVLAAQALSVVDWPDVPFDPFFNINTAEDLARAERHAAQLADQRDQFDADQRRNGND